MKLAFIFLLLIGSIARSDSQGNGVMAVDYDQETITCGSVTYQFDLGDEVSAHLYDVFESAWNEAINSDQVQSEESRLCQDLSVLMPLRD